MTDLLRVTRDQLKAITTDSRVIRQLEKLFEAALAAVSYTNSATVDLIEDITVDTTLTTTQRFNTLDATVAAVNVFLPPLSEASGFIYRFRRVDLSVANACGIKTDGTDKVRLAVGSLVGTVAIGWPSPYNSVQLMAGKNYWEIISIGN